MLNSSELMTIFYMGTIGLSILYETLCTASKINYYKQAKGGEVKACYMWVQGTGLDVLIESYEMDYDPEKLRNGFNWYLRH